MLFTIMISTCNRHSTIRIIAPFFVIIKMFTATNKHSVCVCGVCLGWCSNLRSGSYEIVRLPVGWLCALFFFILFHFFFLSFFLHSVIDFLDGFSQITNVAPQNARRPLWWWWWWWYIPRQDACFSITFFSSHSLTHSICTDTIYSTQQV